MTVLRSEKQVALNDLLVASEKTVDYYRDAADFLDAHPVSSALRRIAEEREPFVGRLEEMIRREGDLPSVPDEDRETVGKIFHRIHASLSHHDARDVLEQRLDGERRFAQALKELPAVDWSGDERTLIAALDRHIASVTRQLEDLLKEHSPE